MAKNHRIVIKVSKEQKEQILQNCKVFGYNNVAEYFRDVALTKNFLVLERLDKIAKFMEDLKNGQRKQST